MRVKGISSFACYYGLGRLARLGMYDLAILQAENYSAEEIASLGKAGTKTAAYVSLGEVVEADANAGWLYTDPGMGLPVRNERWGTVLIDCRSVAWQRHLLAERIPLLLSRGVSGLFLDTVDVQDQAPATRPGVELLLRRIRLAFPHIVLIVNRGFTILDTVREVADGLVFEAFTSHFNGKDYATWTGSDLAWTAQMALRLQETASGMALLALDYASPEDTDLRDRAIRRAQAYNMIPFVTTHLLDWLPGAPGASP